MKTNQNYPIVFVYLGLFFFSGIYGTGIADPNDPNDVSWMDLTDERHYKQVKVRYQDKMDSLAWDEVFKGLSQEFRESKLDWSTHKEMQTRFQRELDSLYMTYSIALAIVRNSTSSNPVEMADVFGSGRFNESNSIALEADIVLFQGTANEIIVDSLSDDLAADLRYRAHALRNILQNDYFGADRNRTLEHIHLAEVRWTNYLRNGFPMYPWESSVNEFFHRKIDKEQPPRKQCILLHPTLAVEVFAGELKDMTAKEVLVLNVLGVLWYKGKLYETFGGLSGIMSFRNDIGAGVGLMMHYGNNWNLGVSYHELDNFSYFFKKNPYIVFSVDLYKLVKSNKSQLDTQLARLKLASTLLKEE